MCVFVQKLNLFDKGWFEKITFTSFAEQFLNICFSFSNHHYNSTICKRSSRYAKYPSDVQNISNHHYISTTCKNISTICKNISTICKNISTISSPLSSPLLKFNDGPILFLLLQRRLLLETLWTTAHWSRLEIASCFGFLLVSDLAFFVGQNS